MERVWRVCGECVESVWRIAAQPWCIFRKGPRGAYQIWLAELAPKLAAQELRVLWNDRPENMWSPKSERP